MKLYIVIIEDRDTGTKAYPFSDKEKAISEAMRVAKERCRNPTYYWMREESPPRPWLAPSAISVDLVDRVFFANYSEECDCATVITTELDKDIQDKR